MGRHRLDQCATLSQHHGWGNFAVVSCNLCRTKRHYLPTDLIALFGDIETERAERRMSCEDCGKRDYVHLRFWKPIAAEEAPRVVRRLERIETIRRPIWRDERQL